MKKVLLIAAVALCAMGCCKKAEKGECTKDCCPKTECVEKTCCEADSCAAKAACARDINLNVVLGVITQANQQYNDCYCYYCYCH